MSKIGRCKSPGRKNVPEIWWSDICEICHSAKFEGVFIDCHHHTYENDNRSIQNPQKEDVVFLCRCCHVLVEKEYEEECKNSTRKPKNKLNAFLRYKKYFDDSKFVFLFSIVDWENVFKRLQRYKLIDENMLPTNLGYELGLFKKNPSGKGFRIYKDIVLSNDFILDMLISKPTQENND